MQSNSFKKLTTGDFSDVLSNLLTNKVSISAPVFFLNAPAVIAKTFAAVQFGFTGISYAPCAVPIVPTGVGVFPQGINIQPEFFNIAPTGAPPFCPALHLSHRSTRLNRLHLRELSLPHKQHLWQLSSVLSVHVSW